MNVGSYFSVKDFLNYYIAGLIWCANIILLLLPKDKTAFVNTLREVSKLSDILNLVLVSVLILVIPYLIGFVLTPISDRVGEKVRKLKPDPVKSVVEDPKNYPAGLKAGEIDLVKKYISKWFLDKNPTPENWFFLIRAVVAQDNSGASLLASRALDLTNFSESLLLPIPLFIFIVGINYLRMNNPIGGFVSLLVAIGVFLFLSDRYIKLRSYWVKHIYRAFIVICLNQEITKNFKQETKTENTSTN